MNNSIVDNSNDSALFVSSLTQKRKATSVISSKYLKQAKIKFLEPTFSENHLTTDKLKEYLVEDNELTKQEVQNKDSTKLLNDFKYIESTSIYFDKKKKPTKNCPLCLKTFENEINSLAHMKQCAKKNKVTTQQLLNALELQKKHMKERKSLGLPSQVIFKPKKATKKKQEEQNQHIECDLSLGIALSKSSEKSKSKSNQKQENYSINEKTKNKKAGKSILKERTNEERQKIITEKAAIVLLQEHEEKNLTQLDIHENYVNCNSYLLKFHNKLSRLWRLSENDGNIDWYVGEIKNFLICFNEENTKEKKNEEFNLNNFSTDNIHNEIKKLNLPKTGIFQNWEKMINNVELSDLVCSSKDQRKFYFHSVVAYVRCPEILKKDYKFIFKNFNLSTILIFLEYLYCGTLNSLLLTDIENLKILAENFDFEELINVLNDLVNNLTSNLTNNEHQMSFSYTPDLVVEEMKIRDSIENKKEEKTGSVFSEDKDLFDEEMVDLTQSSHGSSTVDEEEFIMQKSYWSFLEYEKEKKEEKLREEEEKENSIITTEMEKIETSMKQQKERIEKILNEYEEKESDIQNKLELEKIYEIQRRKSSDSLPRDLEEELTFKSKIPQFNSAIEDCILLSSDSDTKNSRLDVETPPPQSVPLNSFLGEVPSFDPYENYNYLSNCNYSPVIHSQSLLADIKSPEAEIDDLNVTLKAFEKTATNSLHSTPVTLRRSPRVRSSNKKSEGKKKLSDLTSNRILRKSLSLSFKTLKSNLSRRKSLKCNKRKNSKKDNKWLEGTTNSILCEFNKSPLLRSSTPIQNSQFVELTPKQIKEAEIEESVTPYPNYSLMEEVSLKKHLTKYGLKKNLGKKKASKILKHIYEELHPFLNPETGKLVKKISAETPKTSKNKRRTKNLRLSKNKKTLQKTKKNSSTSEELCNLSIASGKSTDSIDRSTEYDSDNPGFEDFEDILTQSSPSDPIDLPSAMKKFLELNPFFHRKILLYEPIWLGDLQKKLKEAFKKNFKMSDVMDYLDQKCITFRSESQKKNNEKRNERKRAKLKKNH